MNFEPPPRPPQAESVVPMINVVFLLLIFFLMSAQLTPPDPFGVEPPESAEGEPSAPTLILQVSVAGEMAFGEVEGEAALDALAAEAEGAPVTVRAHSELAATELAGILGGLASRGVRAVELATQAP